MWKRSLFALLIVAVAGFGCSDDDPTEPPPPPPGPPMVTASPMQDNTLWEDAAGALSGGASNFLFVGQTGVSSDSEVRRGLVQFDLAGIPLGATIDSVFLTLEMTKRPSGPTAIPTIINLHCVQKDWGEGMSNNDVNPGAGAPATAQDATWLHSRFDTDFWTNVGGDFDAAVSGTQTIVALGSYTWGSTAAMVADVQMWLNNGALNSGWILIGDETTDQTARQFASRENPTASIRPTLKVFYTAP